MRKPISILISGVGGQGILTLAEIVGRALIKSGYVAKATEVHGLAQRGGVVVSHIKAANYEVSPMVAPGMADLIIGLELIETVRLARYINKETVVLANKKVIPPVLPGVDVPDPGELISRLKRVSHRVYLVEASAIARRIYGEQITNMVMLGALSGLGALPISRELYIEAMYERLPEKYIEVNLKAFEAGEKAVKNLY